MIVALACRLAVYLKLRLAGTSARRSDRELLGDGTDEPVRQYARHAETAVTALAVEASYER